MVKCNESAEINPRLKKAVGYLMRAESITTSDLPDMVIIEEEDGTLHKFDYYIDSEMVALNNKTVTAYYTAGETKEVTAIELVETPKEAAPPARIISKEVNHYICFNEDNEGDLTIWVSFTAKSYAIQVKYKGMEDAMDLVFIDEVNTNEGGPSPVIAQLYNEVYEGKVNGTYLFTHSGIWDYAEYTRGSDSIVFKFTIDHDANPYGSSPCF